MLRPELIMGRTNGPGTSFNNNIPKKKASTAKAGRSRFPLKEQHVKTVEKTKSHTVECIGDYRRRVMKLVGYVETEYPEEAKELVRELTPEERSDPRYHYHKATQFQLQSFPRQLAASLPE